MLLLHHQKILQEICCQLRRLLIDLRFKFDNGSNYWFCGFC